MGSSSESDTQANRSRRRMSRINYAEDESADEPYNVDTTEEIKNGAPTNGTKRRPGRPPASSLKNVVGVKRDSVESVTFPSNWQPHTSPKASRLALLDLKGATIESDNSLHLRNGAIFSPEGNFAFD